MPTDGQFFKAATLVFLFALALTSFTEPLATPDRDDIEYPDDEAPTAREIELGKILFYDNRLSVNRNQSCATCHNPDLGYGDGAAVGLGTMGEALGRNSPHIYNLAWNVLFFWDGRAASLEEQALGPIEAPGEMNMSLDEATKRLAAVEFYNSEFQEIYGEPVNAENLGRALAAFERTVISDDSAFDKYLSGDKTALGPEATHGLEVFQGKGRCTECHDGANFTDNSFHNLGLMGNQTDPGRGAVIGDKNFNGAFKTPGLRNAMLTGPYMHDGSLASLEAVVRFYNRGGDNRDDSKNELEPLNLTEQEMLDLVAFMGALTHVVAIDRPTIPK